MTDLGLIEDITQFLMHLVCVEHHAKMSYYKTEKPDYKELHDIARNTRQRWLGVIARKNDAEEWCISKHILNIVASGGECANRLYVMEENELGKQMDTDAKLFLGLLYEINDLNKNLSDKKKSIWQKIKGGAKDDVRETADAIY